MVIPGKSYWLPPGGILAAPLYLGDMLLFIGLSLATNSLYLRMAQLITILVFVTTPLAEEPWLEEQHKETYLGYKRDTPRFL